MNNLSTGENIIGDVFIHPTATVDAGAKLGPNVTIGAGAVVEKGTRIKNSIVLEDCHIKGTSGGTRDYLLNMFIVNKLLTIFY